MAYIIRRFEDTRINYVFIARLVLKLWSLKISWYGNYYILINQIFSWSENNIYEKVDTLIKIYFLHIDIWIFHGFSFGAFSLCFASRWFLRLGGKNQLCRKVPRFDTQQAREINNSEEQLYDWHERAGTISIRTGGFRIAQSDSRVVFTMCHVNPSTPRCSGEWKKKNWRFSYPKIFHLK